MSYSQRLLKPIAMITMFIDHTAVCFYYQLPSQIYLMMRMIGRLSFPIYILLASEAVIHTHAKRNYLLRLLILAFLAEIPFNLIIAHTMTAWAYQNVIFTIFFGVSACMAFTKAIDDLSHAKASSIGFFLLTALCLVLPGLFQTDYGSAGALAILVCYLIKKYTELEEVPWGNITALLSIAAILMIKDGSAESFSLLTPLIVLFYNGQTGKVSDMEKRLYRFWYPVHLLLLWIIYYFAFFIR